jgi:hypothetical protein
VLKIRKGAVTAIKHLWGSPREDEEGLRVEVVANMEEGGKTMTRMQNTSSPRG